MSDIEKYLGVTEEEIEDYCLEIEDDLNGDFWIDIKYIILRPSYGKGDSITPTHIAKNINNGNIINYSNRGYRIGFQLYLHSKSRENIELLIKNESMFNSLIRRLSGKLILLNKFSNKISTTMFTRDDDTYYTSIFFYKSKSKTVKTFEQFIC